MTCILIHNNILQVEKITKGLIKDIIDPSTIESNTQAVMVNGLYFKVRKIIPFQVYWKAVKIFTLMYHNVL